MSRWPLIDIQVSRSKVKVKGQAYSLSVGEGGGALVFYKHLYLQIAFAFSCMWIPCCKYFTLYYEFPTSDHDLDLEVKHTFHNLLTIAITFDHEKEGCPYFTLIFMVTRPFIHWHSFSAGVFLSIITKRSLISEKTYTSCKIYNIVIYSSPIMCQEQWWCSR